MPPWAASCRDACAGPRVRTAGPEQRSQPHAPSTATYLLLLRLQEGGDSCVRTVRIVRGLLFQGVAADGRGRTEARSAFSFAPAPTVGRSLGTNLL